MNIRILQEQELLPALHLVWDVFAQDVAPSYTPEGVGEFQNYIKYDNIYPMYRNRQLIFFGAFDETNRLRGVIAVNPPGVKPSNEGTYSLEVHISLFYVRKDMQRKGIGKQLYQCIYQYAFQEFHARKITVNAAPNAVQTYLHLGMRQTAEEQVVNGLRFVPMEGYIIGDESAQGHKKNKTLLIAGIVTGCVLVLALVVYAAFQLGKSVAADLRQEPLEEFMEGFEDFDDLDGIDDYDYEDEDGELSGMDAVPAHIEENLSYEIDDEEYEYQDDTKRTMIIDFQVEYPTISGLADAQIEKKVNDTLKNVAMDTVDKIYTNPSEDMKEKVLQEDYPYLVSYVDYKICYASDELLSVAFQDSCYEGSSEANVHLRTCNINLKNGEVYQLQDIIEINDEFIEDWYQSMLGEVQDSEFLSELDKDQMKQALEGDSLDGVYVVNFFVDEDGIEIGFDLNYDEDGEKLSSYAWVTGPFSYDEIEKYQKDSDFWYFK